MGKYLTILAVGALALTACTSEDVVEDVAKTRNRITFENTVNKHSRSGLAEDLSVNTLTQFNVFGFYTMPANPYIANEVFDDKPVNKQTTGMWTMSVDDERYWVKDAKFYFYAYSCGAQSLDTNSYGDFDLNMSNDPAVDAEGNTITDEKGNPVLGMPASERVLEIKGYICDVQHQHDLVFATNVGASTDTDPCPGITGLESGNLPVGLQFKHILTKVGARFTSKFPAEYDVRIKNVSVENIRNKGNYNPNVGWTTVIVNSGIPAVSLLENNHSISVKNAKDKNNQQLFVDTRYAYVIPTEVDNKTTNPEEKTVSIKFTIDLYFGDNFVLTRDLSGTFTPQWKEGYSYLYNIELSGSTSGLQVIAFTTATDADNNVITLWQSGSVEEEEETPQF